MHDNSHIFMVIGNELGSLKEIPAEDLIIRMDVSDKYLMWRDCLNEELGCSEAVEDVIRSIVFVHDLVFEGKCGGL